MRIKPNVIEKYKDMGLKNPLTNEEVLALEKEHLYPVSGDENITINTPNKKLPFGTKYFTWREMKQKHLSGDGVIWHYDNIGILCGCSGYVLILDDEFRTGWNITTTMA